MNNELEIEQINSKNYWNEVHKNNSRENIKIDNWLDKFIDIIKATELPIIDLGCGIGNDTLYLLQKGKTNIIPCDQSTNAINCIIDNFPEITQTKCFNMLEGLPFDDDFCDIIIADLSLHYFRHDDTEKIIKDIHRVLKENGHLIFRVNSIKDVNHGAGKGDEIEKNLFKTCDNRLKRFFDDGDIAYFFKDFKTVYVNETSMDRYQLKKILYEGCVRK